MKVTWQEIADLLVDPVDHSGLVVDERATSLVSPSGQGYVFRDGQPILLPIDGFESDGWRFPPITVSDTDRSKPSRRLRRAVKGVKRLLRGGVGGQGAGRRLVELLHDGTHDKRPRALMIGGATVGNGAAPLIDSPGIDVVSFDVYPTEQTTFVADAHRIPLADASVSAVWIQAVLEHVYRPEQVVAEIVRVLEPGGFLYAETPFLQPIHEGAYDFVRFNQSGHRLLFSHFDELVSGPLGGPAAVLNLAIRGLLGGLTRSRVLARLAYGLTHPLVLLDRFVPEAWRVDYATGTYFLGQYNGGGPREFDALETYRGANR
jgi:SAM-dependent methyltransferase